MGVRTHVAFQLFLFFLCQTHINVFSHYAHEDIKSWCSQTPNPQPCEYFLTSSSTSLHTTNSDDQNPPHTLKNITHKSDFFKISTKLALDRAMTAHAHVLSFGPKCIGPNEKAAWADCLDLYESAIRRLSSTAEPISKCTNEDTQTWLSSALTDLDTCLAGLAEMGVELNLSPLLANNVSKLISNTLAINKVAYEPTTSSGRGGFPRWVRPGDRKLLQSPAGPKANAVVAQDGSGDYKTIGAAVAGRSGSGRYVIYVKAGTYKENVEIREDNVMLVGDGIGKTIVTGSRSVGGGSTTFNSATVAAVGDAFIAKDMTFRNTAGAANQQAVALRSGSDLSVFYRCSFEGYQDTLYAHSQRQFYRECDIYGTVDFIFGNAAVVLQRCNIFARDPPNKTNTITAQGRTDPNQNTGISIHDSRVSAASDLRASSSQVRTYLGRPWKEYSRTVFMKTYLDGIVNSAGWLEWSGSFALDTLYYAEHGNTGPGSATSGRVKWGGFRVIGASEAAKFTVGSFIAGNSWIASAGVPFTAGL